MATAPFQSKLLPRADFIRECRAQRMSYPRIAAELNVRFGLQVAASTVFAFVKVRARRRTVFELPDSSPKLATTIVARPAHKPAPLRRPLPRRQIRPHRLSLSCQYHLRRGD